MYDNFIDYLMEDLKSPKRKTRGQDHSKSYHKITISVNEKEKAEIQAAAEEKGVSVSMLIKELLKVEGVIQKKV